MNLEHFSVRWAKTFVLIEGVDHMVHGLALEDQSKSTVFAYVSERLSEDLDTAAVYGYMMVLDVANGTLTKPPLRIDTSRGIGTRAWGTTSAAMLFTSDVVVIATQL